MALQAVFNSPYLRQGDPPTVMWRHEGTVALLFQSFHAENYRAFGDLTLSKLRRVNVIGGLNGAGKSTLLEALFVLADYLTPIAVIRPLMFRGMGIDPSALGSAVFTVGSPSKVATLRATTRLGPETLVITEEVQPSPPDRPSFAHFEASTATALGLTLKTEIAGQVVSVTHAVPRTNELQSWQEPGHQPIAFPTCVMLSRRLPDATGEMGDRFSKAVVKGKKKTLIQLLKILSPKVTDITLLQASGVSSLYASFGEDNIQPLSFVGDGASAYISAALAIIDCEGGAVFIDELDAAIHYTLLEDAWAGLIKLAREVNAQIFIASHSQEAIDAVAAASAKIGAEADFQYLRLDRIDKGVRPSVYLHSEYESARGEGWDVR